jgi:hypothetical protein
VRIYFGIFHDRPIKWPDRCSWCNAKATRWHKYKKKTIFDFQYKIFWFDILSRKSVIQYPVCFLHNVLTHILRPSRLIIIFFILIAFTNASDHFLWLIILSVIIGLYIFWKKAIILHKVHENHIELSIPEGKFAEEFGLLNNCHNLDRHLLMQD